MIKLTASFLLVSLTMAAKTPGSEIDYHDTLDDNFDFETASPKEFEDIAKCLADQGPCSDLGGSYRKHYPQAVYEACGRCNVDQKHMVRVLIQRFKKDLPELFKIYRNLHDPENKYFDKYEAAVAGY